MVADPDGDPGGPGPRERHVARDVVDGLSDREIAPRLFLSLPWWGEPGSVGSAGERSSHRVDVVQDPIDGYGCVPQFGLRLGLGQQDQPINAQFLVLVD